MDISELSIGDHHYVAYVGPPSQYDFMGASQFNLLFTMGLRSTHRVLDFGCGSLRAGRFLIAYLDKGHYYGIDPNKWLIDEAIQNQVGGDLIRIKEPSFSYNSDFRVDQFSTSFDFIIAQSIFSHTGSELIRKSLASFHDSLNENGLILASFMEGSTDFFGAEWVYPEIVHFRRSTLKRFAREAGLVADYIPWYHPRQTWYLFSKYKNRLPSRAMRHYLTGAVLNNPEFTSSWHWRSRMIDYLRRFFRRNSPPALQEHVKRLLSSLRRE